jgi:hypothetical protein
MPCWGTILDGIKRNRFNGLATRGDRGIHEGMLPMLAHSRRELFLVKAVSFGAGLLLGAGAMALGF